MGKGANPRTIEPNKQDKLLAQSRPTDIAKSEKKLKNRFDFKQICSKHIAMKAQDILQKQGINLNLPLKGKIIQKYARALRQALGEDKTDITQIAAKIRAAKLGFKHKPTIKKIQQIFIRAFAPQTEIPDEKIQIVQKSQQKSKFKSKQIKSQTINNNESPELEFQPVEKYLSHNVDQNKSQHQNNPEQTMIRRLSDSKNMDQDVWYVIKQLFYFIEKYESQQFDNFYEFVQNLSVKSEIKNFLKNQAERIFEAINQSSLEKKYKIFFEILQLLFDNHEVTIANKLIILDNFQKYLQQHNLIRISEVENRLSNASIKIMVDNIKRIIKIIGQSIVNQQFQNNQPSRPPQTIFSGRQMPMLDELDQFFAKQNQNQNQKEKAIDNKDKKPRPRGHLKKNQKDQHPKQKIKKKPYQHKPDFKFKKIILGVVKNSCDKIYLMNILQQNYRLRGRANYLISEGLKLNMQRRFKDITQSIDQIIKYTTEVNDHFRQVQIFQNIVYADNALTIATEILLLLVSDKQNLTLNKNKLVNCLFWTDSPVNGPLCYIIQWCQEVVIDKDLKDISEGLFLQELRKYLKHFQVMNTNKQERDKNQSYKELIKDLKTSQSNQRQIINDYIRKQFGVGYDSQHPHHQRISYNINNDQINRTRKMSSIINEQQESQDDLNSNKSGIRRRLQNDDSVQWYKKPEDPFNSQNQNEEIIQQNNRSNIPVYSLDIQRNTRHFSRNFYNQQSNIPFSRYQIDAQDQHQSQSQDQDQNQNQHEGQRDEDQDEKEFENYQCKNQ